MAYFPRWWLTFKLCELDVEKAPGLCLMTDEARKTQTEKEKKDRER